MDNRRSSMDDEKPSLVDAPTGSQLRERTSIFSVDLSVLRNILSQLLVPSTPLILPMPMRPNPSCFPSPAMPPTLPEDHGVYRSSELESAFNNVRLACRIFYDEATPIYFTQNTFLALHETTLPLMRYNFPPMWFSWVRRIMLRSNQMFQSDGGHSRIMGISEIIHLCDPVDLLPLTGLRSIEIVFPIGYDVWETEAVRTAVVALANLPTLERLSIRREDLAVESPAGLTIRDLDLVNPPRGIMVQGVLVPGTDIGIEVPRLPSLTRELDAFIAAGDREVEDEVRRAIRAKRLLAIRRDQGRVEDEESQS